MTFLGKFYLHVEDISGEYLEEIIYAAKEKML